jgi:ankyrin repeat protein
MDSYDPYELMMIPPNKKAEMIVSEIKKDKPNLNLVRDLIVLGANLNIQNESGNTALHHCAHTNNPDIARMLIDAGANVNVQGMFGLTALHVCARLNRLEIARMLIDAGANVNIQAEGGWGVLHFCAFWNRIDIAKMFLEAGSDKTIPTLSGKLPYKLAESIELRELLRV